MGKNQHVVMHDDRWAVKEEGGSAPVATFKTQGQAWEKSARVGMSSGGVPMTIAISTS